MDPNYYKLSFNLTKVLQSRLIFERFITICNDLYFNRFDVLYLYIDGKLRFQIYFEIYSRFIIIVVNWRAEMACWRWIFVCTVFEKITKFERERERERVFTENGHVLVVKLSRTVQFCKQIELSWKGVDCLFVAPGFHSFSIMEKSRLAVCRICHCVFIISVFWAKYIDWYYVSRPSSSNLSIKSLC